MSNCIITNADPCSPCLCPSAPCEQCMFGYATFVDRNKYLNNILANNEYSGIVKRYKLYHKD